MWDLLAPYITGSATTLVVILVLGFAAREALGTRIKESIAAEFRREHEKFTSDLRKEHERYAAELRRDHEQFAESVRWASQRKEKAAQIAEVISAWIALNHDPDKAKSTAAYIDMQRKYWELCLWLDIDTLRLLNRALTAQPGADYKQALASARAVLVGNETSPLVAAEVVHFALPKSDLW